MPVPLPIYQQFFDSDGQPRNGGLVYTYVAGTLTPKATFTSADGTVQAQNPVVLNSSGMPNHGSGNVGMIWGEGSYDFVVTNSDGTDPVTIEKVTSFNTIAAAGSSYFETFSGDGTTVSFPTSQDLGTDENAIFVYVDNGLFNYIKNGDFATDTLWTKGTGWTIGAGVATATGAISTSISQTAATSLNPGQVYVISYTITRTAGTITPNVGGVAGTARSVAGTFTETIIAGSSQLIEFTTAGFTGTLDNVSVRPAESMGWQIVPPTQFTLSGGAINFAKSPEQGTNNIMVFAPASLVAAASASAAAAESFSNAANVAATNAAISETNTTALYDDFDDRYLGAYAIDPTTDNDGGALQTGTLYFNTSNNRSRVYNGTTWQDNSSTVVIDLVDGDKGDIVVSGGGSNWALDTPAVYSKVATAAQGALASTALQPNTVLTPWVAYTPSFTGFGTVSGVSFFSRRVGDTLEVQGKVTNGTVTAVEARVSLGFNGVDGGITSTSTLLPSVASLVGFVVRSDAATASYNVLAERSVGYFTFSAQNTSTAGLTKLNANGFIGTGITWSFKASVPIQGW